MNATGMISVKALNVTFSPPKVPEKGEEREG